MAISNIIEVGLGLAVAYYVLGLVVSFLSTFILRTFDTRGKILREYLTGMIDDHQIFDADSKIRQKMAAESETLSTFLNHPQIKALAPVVYDRWWGVIGAKTHRKLVEKIPPDNLLDSLFDHIGLTGEDALPPDELKSKIEGLPATSAIRKELLELYNNGVTDVGNLRRRVGRWAAGLMGQASDQYKANARAWVILLAVLVTALTGLDTIEYAVDLWNNPQRREVAAARANAALQADQQETDIDAVLDEVEALNMKIGWFTLPDSLPLAGEPGVLVVRYWGLKLIGLIITVVAVAQGSSFWFDTMRKFTANPGSNSKVS